MSLISGSSVTGSSAGEAQYTIERSLRFNSADTAYLNRTPASASNRTTWTWSGWVKRSALGSSQTIFALFDYLASPLTNKQHGLRFLSGDTIEYWCYQDPSYNGQKITTQVFRDVSAWYHIVAVWDTPNATAANRMRLYVNGSEVTTFGTNTNPTQNSNGEINRAFLHTIGTFYDPDFDSPISLLNGYLTEINFIDGSALDPTSFGEFNATTGVWEPIEYTGSYGTNGFYLNFSDNSTIDALGTDFSGNGNTWDDNGFSVTAGAGNDSLVDTPTRFGTDTGLGGEVRGNYATLNPLAVDADVTLSNGNLDFSCTSAGLGGTIGTIAVTSGKWYWEVTPTGGTASAVGIAKLPLSAYDANQTGTFIYLPDGDKRLSPSTDSAYGASYTTNDVIGVALDMDAGTVAFYKNGVSQGTAFSSLSGDFTAWMQDGTSGSASTFVANFGQRPFAYTAPSGFKALVTTNLPTPTIEDGGEYFNTVLYTGTGSNRSVTGVGFQPDAVWVKCRSSARSHNIQDVVRGSGYSLFPNETTAEINDVGARQISFDSDGFSISGTNQGDLNLNAATFVAWNWKANGAGVSNTAGTITSTVSANTDSGFSIVTYTGTGSAATIGHGLGAVPAMIIVKNRDQADAWQVYHAANTANPETDYLVLNTTAATADAADRWNDTLPTSTVFSIGDGVEVNTNTEDYVAYVFAAIPGYSAFSSYTGNGAADGPFVFTGFRPAWVMWKITSTTGNWRIADSARNPFNVALANLEANLTDAEGATANTVDFLSNGFKIRGTGGDLNTSAGTIIYMAFAENPFKIALAR